MQAPFPIRRDPSQHRRLGALLGAALLVSSSPLLGQVEVTFSVLGQDDQGRLRPALPIDTSRTLMASAIPRRIAPSAMAMPKFPLRVSSTIAVVMTGVSPRIFPPTIMTAPTSLMWLPKSARIPIAET